MFYFHKDLSLHGLRVLSLHEGVSLCNNITIGLLSVIFFIIEIFKKFSFLLVPTLLAQIPFKFLDLH